MSAVPPPRRPWWRRLFGTRSENAAARYLRRQGFRILTRNYACPLGELDLVAVEDDCIVFVEVRSTAGTDLEPPAQSVDEAKQQRLTRLALHYLGKYRLLNQAARFDVLVMSWPPGQREPRIIHYRQAFEAVGRFQLFS
jgi:putative endonuclease